MQRCLIIGAAPISNYEKVSSYIKKDDFVIVCDGGLNHLAKLKVSPNLIIGDFDSHENPSLPVETIVLPHEKDDTDSVFALKTALSRGYRDFLFIGMLGARLDHSLGNLYMLLKCHNEKASALMLDDFSEMEILAQRPLEIPDTFAYFSLLNITGKAEGITIKNALYNLEEGQILQDYQYGISNEVLPGKTAWLSVKEGCLLLIKVWK
ncbi:MAG: thiamine diphosphokinase [Treponema sp.]|nr:thiamine diphosphokinase [Treponema sp.]